jgi:hypothetical protein
MLLRIDLIHALELLCGLLVISAELADQIHYLLRVKRHGSVLLVVVLMMEGMSIDADRAPPVWGRRSAFAWSLPSGLAVGFDALLAHLLGDLPLFGEGVLLQANPLLGHRLLLDDGDLFVQHHLVLFL